MQPLAIFGGTFDPIHIGHLRAAWEASEALDAEVRIVPAKIPPHRPQPIASANERVAMLRAALVGQGRLQLDLRELEREGPSYTFDTLASLRAEIGGERPLVLLIGADAFAGLSTWHRWRELFDLAHVCVLTRPAQIPAMPDALATEVAARKMPDIAGLREAPSGKVLDMVVSALGISATRIRALLAEGRTPRWLVPQALIDNDALLAPYRRPAC
ncbi:MAG TPA: nicotinate-nucleotide adenylyltransferase [Rhodanobacteraceae bacterium]|jgi:nicotinate-nucleotide adenylyltransferase|nr:nicotinate-nucleotide adenylyltransferase [Rhodanobacteraceae bacterium]